jgi:hypothetical protein
MENLGVTFENLQLEFWRVVFSPGECVESHAMIEWTSILTLRSMGRGMQTNSVTGGPGDRTAAGRGPEIMLGSSRMREMQIREGHPTIEPSVLSES